MNYLSQIAKATMSLKNQKKHNSSLRIMKNMAEEISKNTQRRLLKEVYSQKLKNKQTTLGT